MLYLHPSTRDKINRILRRMKAGRLPVEAGCLQIVKTDPFDAQALCRLADAASTRKEWELARRYYWQALEASPSHTSAYAGLTETYHEAGDDPDLAGSLLFLVYRRMFLDPEFENAGREWYASLPTDSTLARLGEEDAIEALCYLALNPLGDSEDERIADRLRPCRMVQHLIDLPEEGLSRETVDEILAHGSACAPLIAGVLRDWARNVDFPDLPGVMAAALLGEIGDPAVLPMLLEAGDAESEQVANAAAWAAYRLAARHLDLQPRIAGLEVTGQSLTIYDFCCIAVEEDDVLSARSAPRKAQPEPLPHRMVTDFGPEHTRELTNDEASAFSRLRAEFGIHD